MGRANYVFQKIAEADTGGSTLFDQSGTENPRDRMLSAGIAGSLADNRAGTEDPARRSLFPKGGDGAVDRTSWTSFHKPIIVMVLGGLMLGAGCALCLLQYTRAVSVSYTAGTACLSVGLMFLVTGMVWLPVIKQKLQRRRSAQKAHARSTAD